MTPVTWGFCPEDGSPLPLTLFSEIGGRAVGVIGMTGSGKSNVLNDVREGITRCPDARMVQLNGAHMGDETVWEPLSALTLCGPVATDETIRNKIGEALAALCLLVTQRSATLAETGHSTFQPTEDDPAVVVIVDEVDEIVKHVDGAGRALEFLASKQRKSAVCLVLATQRAIISALGGGAVRANMSEVLVGKVARATESRHATGAEKEIPDIREYSKGAPGYFQRWDPHSGTVAGRGRAFLLGKPPDELAYMKRIVAARQHLRDWSIPDLPPLAAGDDGQAEGTPAGATDAHGTADRRHAGQARQHHRDRRPDRACRRTAAPYRERDPFPWSRACPRRSWRPCIRFSLPAAHQPQRQAWPSACRRAPRTTTSPRCARTGTPRSPEAAGPPAGSSRNAQRCPKTSGPKSIGTSRPRRPSAGTTRSRTSPRLPTMASSTSTRTPGTSWRRSAGSPAASASQWSPASQMATESDRANRPPNRPPIRSFSFAALLSKGW